MFKFLVVTKQTIKNRKRVELKKRDVDYTDISAFSLSGFDSVGKYLAYDDYDSRYATRDIFKIDILYNGKICDIVVGTSAYNIADKISKILDFEINTDNLIWNIRNRIKLYNESKVIAVLPFDD